MQKPPPTPARVRDRAWRSFGVDHGTGDGSNRLAQARIWQTYRREDFGFEVEMPGEPEIEEEQDEHAKSIHAEFLFVGMIFGVDHVAFRHDVTIADVMIRQREAAENLKSRITRETPFTMDGHPAIEIVHEMDGAFVSIMRVVVIGNCAIAFNVRGPDIAADPSALRFLNSFSCR